MYVEQSENINESVKAFEDAALKNPDARTENEINMAKDIEKGYNEDNKLARGNSKSVEEILNRIENGETIKVNDVEKKLDGDIIISGESCKDLVKERKLTGMKAIMYKVKTFFKNLINKANDEVTTNKNIENEENIR